MLVWCILVGAAHTFGADGWFFVSFNIIVVEWQIVYYASFLFYSFLSTTGVVTWVELEFEPSTLERFDIWLVMWCLCVLEK